ncbi:MAG: ACP S-malonyltransferase [Puniceicoccales bacterium]|jgi:[acyl-carrier-protein] S-malonyltransferase|nr:ACP S-malonyltransferase [Puniceicoccales bacterium]
MAKAIAIMFSGQGAQRVGMGKDLYLSSAVAREYFEKACDVLRYDLKKICFDGPEECLTRTDHCQVALYVLGYASFLSLRERNVLPEVAAYLGQSLGEWTALTAAGAISFEEGVKFVSLRGQHMAMACSKVKGAMLCLLGGTEENAQALCRQVDVEISNYNAPGQIVISGNKEAISCAEQLSGTYGFRRAIPLKVDGAYHSKWMLPARDALTKQMDELEIHSPTAMVLSNVTGEVHGKDPQRIRELLLQQITAPVRWDKCMQTVAAMGINHFHECGCGNVLSNLCQKNILGATLCNL